MAGEGSQVKPISLFYSYSHKDEDLRLELRKQLAPLRRIGMIAEWHDRKIEAGKEWEKEIDHHLSSADIILLLVSASFIAFHTDLALGAPPANCCHNACLTRAPRVHIIAVLKGKAMPVTLNLKINVTAAGDTTPEEIQAATRRLSVALAERPEVEAVTAATAPAPEGAKTGGEVVALGALLLAVAPAAVEFVLGLIRDMLARPAAPPVEVAVEIEGRGKFVIKVPTHASRDEIKALARELLDDLRAG